MKPVYAFLLGCLITAVVFGIYVSDLKSRLGSTQNQGQFVAQQATRVMVISSPNATRRSSRESCVFASCIFTAFIILN
jgi:hypothetical protein